MKPICKIKEGERNITSTLWPFFISLTLTDNVGLEADTLDIELSNKDENGNKLAWPPRGRTLSVWLGYEGEELYYKGRFVVDELSYGIADEVLGVHAKSVSVIGSGKVLRSQHYQNTTLGYVLGVLASRNNWTLAVSAEYQSKAIGYLSQQSESDLHFLTRLGKQYGASAQVKNDCLVFVRAGGLLTVTGQAMPVFEIPLNAIGEDAQYNEMGRGYYTGAKARYSGGGAEVVVGSTDVLHVLHEIFDSADQAREAAEAELRRINGYNNTLAIPLDHGWPGIVAEAEIKLDHGWPDEIRGQVWAAKSVVHSLGDGLSTTLDCVNPEALIEIDEPKTNTPTQTGAVSLSPYTPTTITTSTNTGTSVGGGGNPWGW